MKVTSAVFICLIMLIVFGGCSRKTLPSTADVRQDSTHIREKITEHDQIITAAEEDSACTETPLSVTDGKVNDVAPVTTTSGRSTLTTSVKDGKLNAKCNCDSVTTRLKWTERELYEYKSHSDTSTKIIQLPPERYVPKIVSILAWVGGIGIILIIALIMYRLGMLKINFLK